MAEKRMFSRKLISSDAFLDMSLQAQALFFHLCMRADDDGFIDAPKKVVREIGASQSSLKMLIDKRYILTFPSGVVLIKHWFIHNSIPKDRYTPTVYTDEKSMVKLKCGKPYLECGKNDNKSYTEIGTINIEETNIKVVTNCNQNVTKVETECKPTDNEMLHRLDKNREDKNSIDKTIVGNEVSNECKSDVEQLEHDFSIMYDLYPKKVGKTNAFLAYKQWVSPKGKDIAGKKYHLTNRQIYLAIKAYITEQEEKGNDDTQYWKNFDTLMGRQLLDYVKLDEEDEV